MIALWLLLGALLQDEPGQDPVKIRELVKQLGSEDFGARERADQQLRKLGRAAIPELEKAAQAEDLEVRDRAAQILKAIQGESTRVEEPDREAPPEPAPGPSGLSFRMIVRVPGEDGYELEVGEGVVRLKLDRTGEKFEAKSAEEFKKKFPEQYEKYVKNGVGGVRISRVPPAPAPARPKPDKDEFTREADRTLAEVRKMLEEMQKWLRDLEEWPDPGSWDAWNDDLLKEMRKLERMRKDWARRFREEMDRDLPSGRGGRPPAENEDEGRFGLIMSPPDPEANRAAGLPADEGVTILKVYPDTPAAKLGLREGDTLHKINGKAVLNAVQARSEFSRALNGEEVKAEILRGGKKEVLSARAEILRD